MTSRTLAELGFLTATGREAAVRFERAFAAPPGDLWSALTEPDRVGRWLGRLGGELHVGGAYRLDMADDDADDPAGDRATGEVLACEPPARLLVTWSFPGEQPSEVEVHVEAREAGSALVLEHRRLTRGGARGYGAGWHTFLDHLGLDLADRGEEWTDRFLDLLPTYRALLPALGPERVDVDGDRLVSTDPAATADFLTQWLGWTFEPRPGADGLVLVPGAESVPGALELVGSAGPGSTRPAGATFTWPDLDALRESLTSAVGSGARLVDGEPDDVGTTGGEVDAPGDVRIAVRARAGGPSAT